MTDPPAHNPTATIPADQIDYGHRRPNIHFVPIHDTPFPWFQVLLTTMFVVPLVFVIRTARFAATGAPPWLCACIGAAVGALQWLLIRPFVRRQLRNRVRNCIRKFGGDPPAVLVGATFDACVIYGNYESHYGLERVFQWLASTTSNGLVMRLGPVIEPIPSPITKPFEPRILDESDDGFAELAAQIDPNTVYPAHGSDLALRGFRRKLAFSGTTTFLTIFAVLISIPILFLLLQRRITPGPLVTLAVIAALLLSPTAHGLLSRKQWFIAPAAVLYRTRPWYGGGWILRVYPRTSSALCLLANRNARGKIAIIADAHTSTTTTLTPREANLLLRAWLSPLDPPTPEMLSDLK